MVERGDSPWRGKKLHVRTKIFGEFWRNLEIEKALPPLQKVVYGLVLH